MKEKIANITIDTPIKRAGNVIHQEPIHYDLFRENQSYTLVPCLNEDERRIANLPEELRFVIEDDSPVSLRGKMDGNFHIIQDAFKQLQTRQVFLNSHNTREENQ